MQIGDHKDCITKHIFVGASRLVSKVTYEDIQNQGTFEQNNYYWYHSDHLGSSNFISDTDGNEFEHIEYMPYGETWFEDGGNSVNNYITYKFTGKELDSTTGLYYFGARYYDPKTSLWISADPALGSYLPTGNKENDARLPGMGGAFNHLNLALYHYAGNNPLKYTDPTGKALALAAPLALPGAVMTVLIAALPYLIAIGIAAGIIFLIHQYRHNSDFRNFVNKNRDNIKNISMETIKNIAKTLTPNPDKDPNNKPKPYFPPIGPHVYPDTKPKEDDDRIILYRSTGPEETSLIKKTLRFWPSLNGLERKYFALTEEGARQYAKMAEESFGDPPYNLFETSFPRNEVTPDMLTDVDSGVPSITIPNEKLHLLSPPIDKGKANNID